MESVTAVVRVAAVLALWCGITATLWILVHAGGEREVVSSRDQRE